MGWALEGAALCWLFLRVPHPGSTFGGYWFARRRIRSPGAQSSRAQVIIRAPRSPIFNWYLYTYGIAYGLPVRRGPITGAAGQSRVWTRSTAITLCCLGTVLAFFTVNIEIADYFSTSGVAALTFQFSGNFARDMSYSITWALFALLLLIIGIRKRIAATRYAGLALLGITVVAGNFSFTTFLNLINSIASARSSPSP